MSGHGSSSSECREIFARLSEYLDEELDPAACTHLEAHMTDCPPCQAFLESLRRTVTLARDLPAPELPEEMRQKLLAVYRKARGDAGV